MNSHSNISPVKLTRPEASRLYFLSGVSALVGALTTVSAGIRHCDHWGFWTGLAATYFCGGGTLYMLWHWRDASWRRSPKLVVVHGFNCLGVFLAMSFFIALLAVASRFDH